MLVAEKQLLDAHLRNDLQVLRRMELKMLVNRFATAVPAATMIGGFTFTGVVELDLIDAEYVDKNQYTRTFTGVFHIFAALALSTAVYALVVSSISIVLGQRLAIQATAHQTVRHANNTQELARKFRTVMFALGLSLTGVVGGTTLHCPTTGRHASFASHLRSGCCAATICAIWVRVNGESKFAVVSSCIFVLSLPFIIWSAVTINDRLNDEVDETSTVKLKSSKDALGMFLSSRKHPLPVSA